MNINFDYVENFLIEKSLKKHEFDELYQEAKRNNIPVIRQDSAQILRLLCYMIKPKKVLEIGTAVGYSALLMAGICDCEIDTIEINEDNAKEAKRNFEKYNKKINLIIGDANEVLSTLTGTYDLIFIDAAKGQYPYYLKECKRLLKQGSCIIADNVLYKGMVAGGPIDHKRNRTIIKRLREFIDNLTEDENYETVILPVDDGMLISLKTQETK